MGSGFLKFDWELITLLKTDLVELIIGLALGAWIVSFIFLTGFVTDSGSLQIFSQ